MQKCLAACPSAPSRTSRYSSLLHNAILACACDLSDDPRATDPANQRRLEERCQRELFIEAERPTLSTVHGVMLIGNYVTSCAQHGLGYMYTGIGIRMSHTRRRYTESADSSGTWRRLIIACPSRCLVRYRPDSERADHVGLLSVRQVSTIPIQCLPQTMELLSWSRPHTTYQAIADAFPSDRPRARPGAMALERTNGFTARTDFYYISLDLSLGSSRGSNYERHVS
jgi:hypothetical protein